MRFSFKGFGNLLLVVGFLAFAVLGLFIVNEALQKHFFIFLAFWTFLPIVSWWLVWTGPEAQLFTHSALKAFTSFLIVSVTLLSFLIFLNWEHIRDDIGRRYVGGYLVTHDVEITENGPQRSSSVYAEHPWAERGIWLLEVGLFAGIFGFPAITLTLGRKALDASEAYEDIRKSESTAQDSRS